MATTAQVEPIISGCVACFGSGHVDDPPRVCPACDGYGQLDENGGKHMTMDRLHRALNAWAAKEGWPYGMPIPSLGPATNRPIFAPSHPLAMRDIPMLSMPELMGAVVPRELRDDDGSKIINCWHDRDGRTVYIIEDKDGKRSTLFGRLPCTERMYMAIETMACRIGGLSSRSEMKAMMNLAERLTEVQVDSYMLNGMFIETSKRSGVRYIFRKGKPTLALRDSDKGMRFLAALCLHAVGYYEDTFAGCMPPSDDVLAHLLFMRSDERKFWAQCNQHPIWAVQSGI